MWLAKWVLGTDKWCTCCFRLARCIRLFCCAHRLRSASWARSHAASTARSSRSIAQDNIITRVGFLGIHFVVVPICNALLLFL